MADVRPEPTDYTPQRLNPNRAQSRIVMQLKFHPARTEREREEEHCAQAGAGQCVR